MKDLFLQINVNTRKTVLTSQSLFYKTENFISLTRYLSGIDSLLTKISENIILNLKDIIYGEQEKINLVDCFVVQTSDKLFSFSFKFGYQIDSKLNKYDIVFCDYSDFNNNVNLNLKIDEYVKVNSSISMLIIKSKNKFSNQDFNKLYLISNISGVNFPRLTDTQKELVETLDKNVLVQGVAGSGKTNICIDKIIFTACRNFTGKVLYTTFSRGLLIDTKLKVEMFKKDLEQVLSDYRNNNIVFMDNNHKKALENKLGIYFFSDDDNQIFNKIERIINYLSNKVDYLLIEDYYKAKTNQDVYFINQDYFINIYTKNLTNHQIERCFNKLSNLSKEIIYKEIYGMIMGSCDLENISDMVSLDKYIELRQNSFSRQVCETIYQIAIDFKKYCDKNNLIDNNIASKKLLRSINNDFEYSLIIIDEVQDYTQANLCLFKKLGLKLFCVGDALQMINPSYFSFGYLKNLIYEKDLTEVKELQNNYRNSPEIVEIIDALSDINKKEFGTHNFILKSQSIDNGMKSTCIYVNDSNFIKAVADSKFDNFTFIVSSDKNKKNLKKQIKNQEVLTVSEIKGLERPTVVAYNLLSDNIDKWKTLNINKVNHKQADENSVYRYYYNLFYVGLSRAKQNIFVVENYDISQFNEFFRDNFENKNSQQAISILSNIVSKVEFTQEEIQNRVNEFVKLGQYDNANFMANKLKDNHKRIDNIRIIEVNKDFVQYGKYREAGVKFWEYGLIDEAKKQFTLSGDLILIDLIDKCVKNNTNDLNIDIIDYFEDVKDNKVARDFILETIKKDVIRLKNSFSNIKKNFLKDRK